MLMVLKIIPFQLVFGVSVNYDKEYMWSAFNVLEKGPKISYPTNRNDTQLNMFDINKSIAVQISAVFWNP